MQQVIVNFSDQAYGTLQDIAARNGTSMAETLREAIALKLWFDNERAAGNRILIEKRNGQIRELLSVSA